MIRKTDRKRGDGTRRISTSRRLIRALLAVATIVVVLIAAVAIAGWWALSTTDGGRWLLGHLQRRLPIELEASLAEGDLLGPLVLEGVRYSGEATPTGALTVEIERLEIDWRPRALFIGKLALERVAGRSVTVDMPPASEPFEPVDLYLPLDLSLSELTLSDVALRSDGEPMAEIDRLRVSGTAAGRRVRLDRLEATAGPIEASAAGTLTTAGSYPLSLDLDGSTTLEDGLELAARGHIGGDLDLLLVELEVEAPVAVPLSGSIGSPLDSPTFELTAELDGIDPRAVDDELPPLLLDGTVDFQGVADSYRLVADVALRSDELPDGRWRFEGEGDRAGFEIERLQVALPAGEVEANGSVAWAPEIAWDLTLKAHDADPTLLLPDWPGRIDFEATTSGRWTEAGADLVAAVTRMEGELRNRPVRGELDLEAVPGRLDLRRLILVSGEARIEASGEIAEAVDLRWSIAAKDLEALHPDLRGGLVASGTAVGPRDAPHVQLSLTGDDLGYQSFAATAVSGEVDLTWNSDDPVQATFDLTELAWDSLTVDRIELRATGDRSDLTASATADRLSFADHDVDRLNLELTGGQQRHEIGLEIAAEDLTARFGAVGGLAGDLQDGIEALSWVGSLERADLETSDLGAWRLDDAVELELGARSWSATAACWQRQGPGRVCVVGGGEIGGAWSAEGDLDELPLDLFAPFLPEEIDLSGSLTAGISAAVDSAGRTTADLAAEADGSLILGKGERRSQPRDFQVRVREGRVGPDGARLVTELESSGSRLAIALELPDPQPIGSPLGPRSIRGTVHGGIEDLSPFEPFVLGVRNLGGLVAADLTIGGTVADPTFVGEIELQAAMDLPALGVRLDRVDLRLQGGDYDTVRLDGEIESGQKVLRVSGFSPIPPSVDRPAVVRLDGESFKIVDTPQAQVWTSPRLQMTLHPGRVEIGGELDLPRGEIEIAEAGRDAVPVSSDVVIVGGPDEPAAAGPTVVADVRLNFGDRFTVDGPGFHARLGGGLRVVEDGSRSPVGHGTVTISGGRFRGYGQDLRIEEGRVIFTGGPIDNPSLNIPAYRRARDGVIAGIRIHGTLERPEAELYSIPSLPESEILSYILTGRGPRRGETNQDANAASLGLAQSTAVLNQMGLQNVSLRTDGSLDETEIVLGRYLSPGLYVSYGIGVFEQLNTLRLRFEITDNWAIEVDSSSKESGADLFYTFEK